MRHVAHNMQIHALFQLHIHSFLLNGAGIHSRSASIYIPMQAHSLRRIDLTRLDLPAL